MIRFLLVILLFGISPAFTSENSPNKQYKVGLCVVATGKYDAYAQRLIESARTYFCKNHQVTFFVFTNGTIEKAPDVVVIPQDRLGWPFDTLKRFHIYDAHQECFKEMDFVFATDADMLFVAPVGDEILSSLVGTQHPGYVGKRGTFEKNKASKAYVSRTEGKTYFAGGFYGGKRDEFLQLVRRNVQQIDADLQKGFIAIWHDESHLNRYFIDHPPTRILDPSYCYPESWNIPFPKKLVALDKNHAELRK
jgi:histo-blood group ABO system transferase